MGRGRGCESQVLLPVVSNPLSVDAVVRSRSDYRYGLEFVELNPVQREIIGKTCRTLALLQS